MGRAPPDFLFPDIFELPGTLGSELYSRDIAKGFFQIADQGSDFLSFQNMLWAPFPEGECRAPNVCDLINQYKGMKEIVHRLIRNT